MKCPPFVEPNFAALHESGYGTKQEDIAVQQVVRY
jgi:hypothetical protein